eukprot:CAMPEP_0116852814 /NCGR_PEP_ID=MMETSP0418-20121206/17528_1 /TAXON_ID=1158023 /ORGANISM="Astrosyne radiata, Strain 13vi08-1A" /LENGTH=444 /DNA_ID=CAMNT_0004485071 /DNA_START=1434 /DNA_END=2768 /DNA_ORIENTATION=+
MISVPREIRGEPSGAFGARGNEVTCKIGGFLVQLGLTSIFYNSSLCIYYYLVIVNSWSDSRLKKIRVWMHVFPLALGFGLAFVGIPWYGPQSYGCMLNNFPMRHVWLEIALLGYIPMILTILFLTGLTLRVYLYVSSTSKHANKWRIETRLGGHRESTRRDSSQLDHYGDSGDDMTTTKRSTTERIVHAVRDTIRGSGVGSWQYFQKQRSHLEKEVMWHAVAYMMAFWITWPLLLVALLIGTGDEYWFFFVVFFVAPLQGFNNALVYFRSRLFKRRKQKPPAQSKVMGQPAGRRQEQPVTRTNLSSRPPNSRLSSLTPTGVDATERPGSLQGATDRPDWNHSIHMETEDPDYDPCVAIAYSNYGFTEVVENSQHSEESPPSIVAIMENPRDEHSVSNREAISGAGLPNGTNNEKQSENAVGRDDGVGDNDVVSGEDKLAEGLRT